MTRTRWTLLAAILGSSIVFLDTAVVNVALPRIGRELPVHLFGVLEGQTYVYNAYLLTLSTLLILAGAINDFYGRRRMFAVGLVGFGAASLLCGLAPNMEFLIVARVLQGAAGAVLVPGSLALIRVNLPAPEQGRAFGLWAGASSGTTILGPLLGGILVDNFSWRWAFLINAALVVLALWAVRKLPESRDEQASPRFDWLGAAIIFIGVGGLAIGAIYGQQREWRDPIAFLLLAVGVIGMIALPLQMRRSRHPLIPLGLFRSRNFTVTNISTLLIYGALYVTFYFLVLFQQGTLGYTAAAAGLGGLPGSLLLTFMSSRAGALSSRYGPRWFMAIGPFLMGLGILWFARVPVGSPAWRLYPGDAASFLPPNGYLIDFLPGSILFGVGLAILVAPLTAALMASVPERNSGVGSAINNAISRIGPQLAGALVFVAITATFYAGLAARVPGLDPSSASVRSAVSPLNTPGSGVPRNVIAAARGASTDAFHAAMLVSAVLLFAGAVVNAVGIRSEVPAAEARRNESESEVMSNG